MSGGMAAPMSKCCGRAATPGCLLRSGVSCLLLRFGVGGAPVAFDRVPVAPGDPANLLLSAESLASSGGVNWLCPVM